MRAQIGIGEAKIIFHPKKTIFFIIYFLAFIFSGFLTVINVIPYRMGLVSFCVIPLLFLYGLRLNRVVLSYGILVVIITFSAIYNNSSLVQLFTFLRILIFSFLIYYLVEVYINQENIINILKLSIGIAIIQLPIVLFQQLFYTSLPARFTQNVAKIDFDFGTFNANDAPLSIFLTLLVIFILFDKKRNYFIRHKWPIALWLTLTVLIVNAELVKIIIVMVWGIYIIRYLNFKVLISTLILFVVIVASLATMGMFNEIWSDFRYSVSTNLSTDPLNQEAFLSGNYGRGAAVAYYLNNKIKWLGDGPSKYYNAFTKTRAIGNTGHIFTFYSEIGIFGWLMSMLIFFFIAIPGRKWILMVSWIGILSFFALFLLSFTTQIMNDISIFLIFCIINKSFLIPVIDER